MKMPGVEQPHAIEGRLAAAATVPMSELAGVAAIADPDVALGLGLADVLTGNSPSRPPAKTSQAAAARAVAGTPTGGSSHKK